MIPQIGFAEMLVLALLAIIVVGPKDLPKLMRSIGGFMARMRAMGAEFRQAFDDMGAEDELAEMRREIEELKNLGKLSNLSDAAFEEDMRAIDAEIRDATDMTSLKAPSQSSSQAQTPTKPPTPAKTTPGKATPRAPSADTPSNKAPSRAEGGAPETAVTQKPEAKTAAVKKTTAKKKTVVKKKATTKKPTSKTPAVKSARKTAGKTVGKTGSGRSK